LIVHVVDTVQSVPFSGFTVATSVPVVASDFQSAQVTFAGSQMLMTLLPLVAAL